MVKYCDSAGSLFCKCVELMVVVCERAVKVSELVVPVREVVVNVCELVVASWSKCVSLC